MQFRKSSMLIHRAIAKVYRSLLDDPRTPTGDYVAYAICAKISRVGMDQV